jgi:ABC-type sugar transport system substrate-binding protein
MSLFLLSSDNAYQNLLRRDAEAAAARHEVALTILSADNDANRQAHEIRQVIQQPADKRPEAILVAPSNEAKLSTEAREAAKLGIAWALLNRSGTYVQDLRREFPKLSAFNVYADQYQVGHIQGKQFTQLLQEGGHLFYVQGPVAASSAERRLAGVREELASTQLTLDIFQADWTSAGAQQVAQYFGQSIEIGSAKRYVVGAQNDDMALGVRQVLEQLSNTGGRHELRDIAVTGCDGAPLFGQRMVDECTLAATVVIPPTAGRAVDAIALALNTGRPHRRDIVLKVASYPPLDELTQRSRKSSTP